MSKVIPAEWVRTTKKHIDRLKASDDLNVFLDLILGHPEPLHGNNRGKYSVRITGNVRLVFRPANGDTPKEDCKEIVIEGVVDYHGAQETWYIP